MPQFDYRFVARRFCPGRSVVWAEVTLGLAYGPMCTGTVCWRRRDFPSWPGPAGHLRPGRAFALTPVPKKPKTGSSCVPLHGVRADAARHVD
jgi:hypothetical protein